MAISKAVLKQPTGVMANIIDLGDYYALGSTIIKKDLTVAQLDKAFSLYEANGDPLCSNSYCIYQPSNKLASSFYLKGSGASIKFNELATAVTYGLYGNCHAFFDDGKFSNTFDSKMGATSGKRLIVVITNSSQSNQASPFSYGIVNVAGDVSWSIKNLGESFGGKVFIFAESTNCLYVAGFQSYPSVNCTKYITKIDKVTGLSTMMLGVATNLGLESLMLKYLGETSDKKCWFSTTPYGAAPAKTSQLLGIDLATDTAFISNSLGIHGAVLNAVGVYIPTSFSLVANDATKYKFYSVADSGNAAGALTIKMVLVPVGGLTTAANFTTPVPANCTLTGVPAIGMAYSAATLGTHACEVDSWLFKDSGNEYLAIAYHSVLDPTSTLHSTDNLCDVARHAVYVFLVDPANPLNLIYKSTLKGNAFGSGSTLNILLRSTDGKTCVAANSSGFTTLTWNSVSEAFVNGTWTVQPLMNIHLDTANQIWVRDFGENIYLFSPTLSSNIVVNFDAPVFNLTGTSGTVNALVSSYDLTGTRQAVPVNLFVSGGLFANSTTAITVTTLISGDLIVPVTVTAAGTVTVTPVL